MADLIPVERWQLEQMRAALLFTKTFASQARDQDCDYMGWLSVPVSWVFGAEDILKMGPTATNPDSSSDKGKA